MIVDTIAPVVDGITEGNTYCINAKFTVSDENIDKVTDTTASAVTTITAVDGVYTLSAGTHKITVSDKAGNSTVVNVTVMVNIAIVNQHIHLMLTTLNVQPKEYVRYARIKNQRQLIQLL